MTESAGYQLENLPIGEDVVRDAQYLGHQNNGGSRGVLVIKRLCYNICRTLNSDALKKIFNMKNDSTDSLIGAVTEEFKLYQLEKIPSSFYEAKQKETRERCIPIRNMHMVVAVDVAATDTDNDSKYVRIDFGNRNIRNILEKCWRYC